MTDQPTTNKKVRVVCVDDHPSIRENLRYLIDAEPDLEVIAVGRDGVGAVRLVRDLRPDVLVVDYDLPDLDGLSVARVLRRECIKPRIVLYTMEREACVWAGRSGVEACVIKDESSEVLVNTVRLLGHLQMPRSARVLVVEDDPDVRHVMRAAIEDGEHEVVEARDGLEALAQIRRQAPSVVVLDLRLPEMSGADFVAEYRRLSPKGAPIIVVSAIRDGEKIAQELGAAAFVEKPFSIDDLAATVARLTPN